MPIYDHAVIYNGQFYPANTPIDEKKAGEATAEEKAVTANDNKRSGRKSKTGDSSN